MKSKERRRKRIVAAVIFVSLALIWWVLTYEHSLPFELEASVEWGYVFRDEEGNKTDPYGFRWYTVSEKPSTGMSEASLRRFLGPDYPLDFEKYTYILVEGCTLKKLSYSLPVKIHKEYGYIKYPAFVELGLDCSPSSVNIYKTPKKWLFAPTKNRLNPTAEKIVK